MGAFGILLNSYFGGTKHDVSTWKEPIKKSDEQKLEEDNRTLEFAIGRIKETIEFKGKLNKEYLDFLSSDRLLDKFQTKEVKQKYLDFLKDNKLTPALYGYHQ